MFTDQPQSTPGRSLQALLYAVASTALAVGSVYLGAANIVTIRYRTLYFPSWTFYALAGAFLAAAVAFALTSRAQRCTRCSGEWHEQVACFPTQMREQVVRSLRELDLTTLRALPAVSKDESRIQLTVQACEKCAATGSVRIDRWESDEEHCELNERNIEGDAVRALYELAASHAEQRGADD